MKTHLRLILLFVLLWGAAPLLAEEDIYSTSLVKLIGDPIAYEGKQVSVRGFLGRAGFNLYLTEAHENMNDAQSSIEVINPTMHDSAVSEYCGGNYAIVEGRVANKPDSRIPASNNVGNFWIEELKRIMIYTESEGLKQCWPEDQT